MSNRFFFLVEGPADQIFFERIIKPYLAQKYTVHIWPYANKKKEKIKNIINSITSMNSKYLFVTDCDNNLCPVCKIRKVSSKFPFINKKQIIVVIKEIESWYLAGFSHKAMQYLKIKIKVPKDTQNVTKEGFYHLIGDKHPKRQILAVICKHYDFAGAAKRNQSFTYLIRKCNIEQTK